MEIIVDQYGNEHVIEELSDGGFRSTPKIIWDEQQAAAKDAAN